MEERPRVPVNVDDLAARFQSCTLPKTEWTHQAHLLVGLWHVHRYGAEEALARLRIGITRLNESHGCVNTTTNGYHETITAAYLTLLTDYLENGPSDLALAERAARLLESPLADRNALFTFYSRERLMSVAARMGHVEPDLAPLTCAMLVAS
jgi:hypothetical protein